MPDHTAVQSPAQNSQLSPVVQQMRRAYFDAVPEICTERALLITRFSREARLFGGRPISVLDKAKLYRRVLEARRPVVWHRRAYCLRNGAMEAFEFDDRSPFAGATTSKFKGVPLYPEFLALTLWPELWSISTRASNPYFLSDRDREVLNAEIFPAWLDDNLLELARKEATPDERRQLQLLQKFVFFIASKPNCISHTVPDFSRAVNEGLRAIIEDATRRGEQSETQKQREFYQAIVEVLEGLIAHARALAVEARRLAAQAPDDARRSELREIASIYERVPEQPARTFREGLTAVWLCWTAVHLENANVGLSLGRLDQVLGDLYRRDVEAGRLTAEQAVELVCHLWLKIGDHVPTVPSTGEELFGGTGSNQAITIGGVDAQGRDAVNDLTYVMLRATELMMLRDPNLNARYYPGVNPKQYLRRLCEANLRTHATPALHNDKAVIASLTANGHTLEQARDYAIVGCVEPGSNGRCYSHSGALLVNLSSALELALFNGRHRHTGLDRPIGMATGDPGAFRSYEGLRAAFEKQLRWLLDQAVGVNELLGRAHQKYYPTPILSALFRGPMEHGKDLIEGGAESNASGVAIIGFADVADSLSAIEQLVFVEKSVRFPDLLAALVDDFAHQEALRTRLANAAKTPKYGNESPVAESNARWLVEAISRALSGRRNYRGGIYRAGYWTMTNHAGLGRLTRATPNGRRAGENFASGITPVSGATSSLTAVLNSVAALPAAAIANGMALNLKYTPEADEATMADSLAASVEGYFDDLDGTRDGGMEVQFNITSHETLVEAVAHPDPELLVRVSGYTAYFKDLNPQMQREIIERTEYELSTGRARSFPPFVFPEKRG
jgi:pyruvate formate-lyase/glycerol dehydratase family glycyl radical enzyme